MGEFAEKYCHRLNVGSVCARSNVFMAPLYSHTGVSFRLKVGKLGAGIAFTEMIHAEDLLRGKKKAVEAARMDPQEEIKALQLIGDDPSVFRRLCEGTFLDDADLIDLNMGCAIPEIVRAGKGCALVHDLPRAGKIIEACKISGKTVTVKCRPGMDLAENRIQDFARMCEEAGADLLTVHGRPGNRMHEGPVYYDTIADAKASVHIPVIGNGGICSGEDAVEMICHTGADGIMIGRWALEHPEIFEELTGGR